MQHMPDKEFDQLFKDKFNEAEIEPSVNLWDNIEQQLTPQGKRTLPIYWMAAASIAIAITAMLVFQKKEIIQLRGTEITAVAEVPTQTNSADYTADVAEVVTKKQAKVAFVSANAEEKTGKVATLNVIEKNNEAPLQPNEQTVRLPIKAMDVKPLDVTPIKETAVENQIVIASAPVNNTNNVITETEETTERRGIRNVGDIVNYVVDKVDKRDKKLVRFNTDDDDNSSIVGINIGFLKFNKKNR